MDHISSWLLSHLSQNVPKIGLKELQICYQMRWKCLTYTCQLWDQGGPPARNKALIRHPKNNDSITACAQQDEAMLFGDPHECQWNLQHCFFSQPHSALTNRKILSTTGLNGWPVPVGHQYGSNLMLSCMSNLKNGGGGVQKTQETLQISNPGVCWKGWWNSSNHLLGPIWNGTVCIGEIRSLTNKEYHYTVGSNASNALRFFRLRRKLSLFKYWLSNILMIQSGRRNTEALLAFKKKCQHRVQGLHLNQKMVS